MKEIPLALTYDDVLLRPRYSRVASRGAVFLKTNITPRFSVDFPVVAINMQTIVNVAFAKAFSAAGGVALYPRFAPPEIQTREVHEILLAGHKVIPAVGIKDLDFERVKLLYEIGVRVVTVDVAHAHSERTVTFIKKLKTEYSDLEIIAGVIATYEGARDLFEAGADSVRVGVGPGTICTTRKVTGCGVPQITATLEASRAAREYDNRPVITDGGTKCVGDIVKALAAGASAVIAGSQFAGATEAAGDLVERDGKLFKTYNGSTSKTEKLKQLSQLSEDKDSDYCNYIEGVESLMPLIGPVRDVILSMEKGIRSGMSFCDAFTISEMHEKAQFVRVSPVSAQENGAHGVFAC